MSRVTDPTTPLSTETNAQGGINAVGNTEERNQLNGGSENDLILTAPPEAGADAGTGDAIDGSRGDDTVATYGGEDSVLGGEGSDLLFSNQGNDSVSGEEGDDSLFAGQGDDRADGGVGNDVIDSGFGDDTASGGAGNDVAFGGRGNDLVEGEEGDDTALGGQGSDSIEGGEGNDIIAGDRGADLLSGGQGNDTFSFAGYNSSGNTPGAIGGDTMTDFTSGEDKIALDREVFSAIGDTLEAVEFETTTQIDGASAAHLIYNEETGELVYNPTPELGDEVTIATLENNPDLNLGDFEVF